MANHAKHRHHPPLDEAVEIGKSTMGGPSKHCLDFMSVMDITKMPLEYQQALGSSGMHGEPQTDDRTLYDHPRII